MIKTNYMHGSEHHGYIKVEEIYIEILYVFHRPFNMNSKGKEYDVPCLYQFMVVKLGFSSEKGGYVPFHSKWDKISKPSSAITKSPGSNRSRMPD